jgi:hypothetical protein
LIKEGLQLAWPSALLGHELGEEVAMRALMVGGVVVVGLSGGGGAVCLKYCIKHQDIKGDSQWVDDCLDGGGTTGARYSQTVNNSTMTFKALTYAWISTCL